VFVFVVGCHCLSWFYPVGLVLLFFLSFFHLLIGFVWFRFTVSFSHFMWVLSCLCCVWSSFGGVSVNEAVVFCVFRRRRFCVVGFALCVVGCVICVMDIFGCSALRNDCASSAERNGSVFVVGFA